MENRFYVYLICDPETGNPFYVGKGCGDRIRSTLKNGNKSKLLAIWKIRQRGLDPIVRVHAENISEREAFKIERQLIKSIPGLTNAFQGTVTPEQQSADHARHMLSTMRTYEDWAGDRLTNWTEAMLGIWGSHRAFYDWYKNELSELASA